MGFYKASKQEKINILNLVAKFEEFFGEKIDFADKVIAHPANMVHGRIDLPTREARDSKLNWLRLHNYWLHLSVYKVDATPESSYMINFSRRVDFRKRYTQEWDLQQQYHKIYVYGKTPEEAFERFLEKFGDYMYDAEDLGGRPYDLVQNYLNPGVTKA